MLGHATDAGTVKKIVDEIDHRGKNVYILL